MSTGQPTLPKTLSQQTSRSNLLKPRVSNEQLPFSAQPQSGNPASRRSRPEKNDPLTNGSSQSVKGDFWQSWEQAAPNVTSHDPFSVMSQQSQQDPFAMKTQQCEQDPFTLLSSRRASQNALLTNPVFIPNQPTDPFKVVPRPSASNLVYLLPSSHSSPQQHQRSQSIGNPRTTRPLSAVVGDTPGSYSQAGSVPWNTRHSLSFDFSSQPLSSKSPFVSSDSSHADAFIIPASQNPNPTTSTNPPLSLDQWKPLVPVQSPRVPSSTSPSEQIFAQHQQPIQKPVGVTQRRLSNNPFLSSNEDPFRDPSSLI
jgi:hypothetical protein